MAPPCQVPYCKPIRLLELLLVLGALLFFLLFCEKEAPLLASKNYMILTYLCIGLLAIVLLVDIVSQLAGEPIPPTPMCFFCLLGFALFLALGVMSVLHWHGHHNYDRSKRDLSQLADDPEGPFVDNRSLNATSAGDEAMSNSTGEDVGPKDEALSVLPQLMSGEVGRTVDPLATGNEQERGESEVPGGNKTFAAALSEHANQEWRATSGEHDDGSPEDLRDGVREDSEELERNKGFREESEAKDKSKDFQADSEAKDISKDFSSESEAKDKRKDFSSESEAKDKSKYFSSESEAKDNSKDFSSESEAKDKSKYFSSESEAKDKRKDFSSESETKDLSKDFQSDSEAKDINKDFRTESEAKDKSKDFQTESEAKDISKGFRGEIEEKERQRGFRPNENDGDYRGGFRVENTTVYPYGRRYGGNYVLHPDYGKAHWCSAFLGVWYLLLAVIFLVDAIIYIRYGL